MNEPLPIGGTNVYLLGNGYAPTITVTRHRRARSSSTTPSRSSPQADPNLTSLGFVKIPDGLKEQVGMIGFFYPTVTESADALRAPWPRRSRGSE
ncbi:cytochrome c biogenesis protein ResB [Leifsonia sp. L25]|uniref:cytochrome c biogenesis protein ResB n=1 Tax=Leifsonia sp. L25 TaxID=3423957 RepID=UPI003D69447E